MFPAIPNEVTTMSSIDLILKTAAPEAVRPDPGVVDADLARGRAALANARRRGIYQRVSVGGVALAAAGVATLVVTTSGTTRSPSTTGPGSRGIAQAKTTPRTGANTSVKTANQPRVELVSYTGTQLPGFTVAQIPQGWQLSTSTSTALLITPSGSTNNDPDNFEGKLAVLTSSVDQHGLGSGDPVTVDGQPGRVSEQSGILMLIYNTPNGFGVNVQAPSSLHWSDAQIVEFAEGVQVTSNAVHTRG
jgi:hypothetical protein